MKFLILFTFLISSSSFAFLGIFESEPEVDPRTLKTEESRMNWLKKHSPELFDDIKKGNKATPNPRNVNEEAWEDYLDLVKKGYDPEEERKRKEENLREMREAQKRQELERVEKMKQGYKLVNGELISLEEQEKLKKAEEQKKIEMKRVIDFYNEMDMKLPENPEKIKTKED